MEETRWFISFAVRRRPRNARFIRSRYFLYPSMPQINTVWMMYRMIGVAVVALMLAGCTERDFGEQKHPLLLAGNLSEWIDKNPCGVLHVRPPLFNVSGRFTGDVKPNTSIRLFVSRDVTFDSSIYVVEHCRPIARMELKDRRRFRLGPLPQGNYVVMVDGRSFEQGQGFPVLDPINDPTYALTLAFHGGTSRYSMAAFSIQPRDDQSNVTGTGLARKNG